MSKYPIRRIPLSIPISFQEDLSKVRKVLISTAFHHPLILDDPKPHMAVTEFAESFIQLTFFVWCHQSHYGQVKDEILERIRNNFIEHNIEIPVPKIGFVQEPLADMNPK